MSSYNKGLELFEDVKREPEIILLDYQATLVSNFNERKKWMAQMKGRRPYSEWINQEVYRLWLLNLFNNKIVILITARSQKYQDITLKRIAKVLEGWQPDENYFNQYDLRPEECKRRIMLSNIMPRYGSVEKTAYLALESNIKTRAMYESLGIRAIKINEPIEMLPKAH
jgi:hypothetical protein